MELCARRGRQRRKRMGGRKHCRTLGGRTTCELGEAVEISVRDNGNGIPAEIMDRLFQPFFTTKPTGEGSDLGLSISYDIATQEHCGTITVDSQPRRYSEFTIWLPRKP